MHHPSITLTTCCIQPTHPSWPFQSSSHLPHLESDSGWHWCSSKVGLTPEGQHSKLMHSFFARMDAKETVGRLLEWPTGYGDLGWSLVVRGEKWLNYGYILKMWSSRFAEGLDMRCTRKSEVKDHLKTLVWATGKIVIELPLAKIKKAKGGFTLFGGGVRTQMVMWTFWVWNFC